MTVEPSRDATALAGARRPTIRDVAREAGVSFATVSRFLNGGRWVGAESSRAIEAAIRSTGFRSNRAARSLATGRSSTVVFLLTEPQDRFFGDPNYQILLGAATAALAERDLALVLMTASTADERDRAMDFIAGHVDGVLLVSSHVGDPILERLVANGIPVVSCGRPMGWETHISSVSSDDRQGAFDATSHLIESGRRRIATICGPLDLGGAHDRLAGYRDAIEAAGSAADPRLAVEGDWSHASGRAAMQRLLETAPDLDGVFAANDAMAAGAVAVLRAWGRRMPADVAVIGFDDAGLADRTDPPLSSMRQPFRLISREMIRVLCEQRPGDAPVALRLPTRLVVRASTSADAA